MVANDDNVDNGMEAAAAPGTFLRAVVGSKLHGLNLEGTDDTDEMGVTIEPPAYVIGLKQFEQWVYRTQPEGAPSGPSDLDLTVYSLRKWIRLALAGNPTVLLLLFAPREMCAILKPMGEELQSLAPAIISRASAGPYLGYLRAQKQRLMGERGGRALRKQTEFERPNSGYDTKYAMHMVRLGIQGVELLSTGRITLPMPEADRVWVMAVRRGAIDLNEVLTRTGELERQLADLQDVSPLRDRPDEETVEAWMVSAYLRSDTWKNDPD
jgi:hypothetical protein